MEIPNIWLPAPGIAEAFRVIDEMKPDECDGLIRRLNAAFGKLSHVVNQGKQADGIAGTKAKAAQPRLIDDTRAAMKHILIESVPGLQYGSDTSMIESQLKADIEVVRELFRRTYGVEIRIGE